LTDAATTAEKPKRDRYRKQRIRNNLRHHRKNLAHFVAAALHGISHTAFYIELAERGEMQSHQLEQLERFVYNPIEFHRVRWSAQQVRDLREQAREARC
jgi:hypothetical protein